MAASSSSLFRERSLAESKSTFKFSHDDIGGDEGLFLIQLPLMMDPSVLKKAVLVDGQRIEAGGHKFALHPIEQLEEQRLAPVLPSVKRGKLKFSRYVSAGYSLSEDVDVPEAELATDLVPAPIHQIPGLVHRFTPFGAQGGATSTSTSSSSRSSDKKRSKGSSKTSTPAKKAKKSKEDGTPKKSKKSAKHA